MRVWEFTFDHERKGNLFSTAEKARKFAVEWLFYNYKYKTEARVWANDILSGRVSEFDFASGGHVALRELELVVE